MTGYFVSILITQNMEVHLDDRFSFLDCYSDTAQKMKKSLMEDFIFVQCELISKLSFKLIFQLVITTI